MMEKSYLGDGVYVDCNEYGQVVLTTSDGIEDINTIYLEPEVVAALLYWLDQKMDKSSI